MDVTPTNAELEEACGVVRKLLPEHRRPRWCTVLMGDPARWSRLDMDDLFRLEGTTGLVTAIDPAAISRLPELAANPAATMFRFTAAPHFARGRLQELIDKIVDDDALIVVRGGAVVLASHHASGWVVGRP